MQGRINIGANGASAPGPAMMGALFWWAPFWWRFFFFCYNTKKKFFIKILDIFLEMPKLRGAVTTGPVVNEPNNSDSCDFFHP